MVFTPVVVGMSFFAHAQEMTQEIKGTVSRIDGNKLTIRDDMNMEKTVQVKDKDLESLKQIKVGDRVLVMNGKVTKGDTR
jgi:outer membrane lipoprotein SlyB